MEFTDGDELCGIGRAPRFYACVADAVSNLIEVAGNNVRHEGT